MVIGMKIMNFMPILKLGVMVDQVVMEVQVMEVVEEKALRNLFL
jgi:hypothetical protein